MHNRIEFVDLAKGICIVLVVMGHCGVNITSPGFQVLRMPLYFILSGLFFKEYRSFIDFLIKKTNKLIIPFLFFYTVSYLLFYAIKLFHPSWLFLLKGGASGFFDLFTNRQFFNGPIWFLLALFWCNIYFYLIQKVFKRDFLKIAMVILIGALGYTLGSFDIFTPLFIDVAMSALPFFAIGFLLKKSNLLSSGYYDRGAIIASLLFYFTALIVSLNYEIKQAFHYNKYEEIIPGFVVAVSSVMSVMLLCKKLVYIPILSYLGRYSIIVLCTHHLINRPMIVLLQALHIECLDNNWLVFLLTIAICYALIPFCLNNIPFFVAQRDLIR